MEKTGNGLLITSTDGEQVYITFGRPGYINFLASAGSQTFKLIV